MHVHACMSCRDHSGVRLPLPLAVLVVVHALHACSPYAFSPAAQQRGVKKRRGGEEEEERIVHPCMCM